MGKRVGAMLHRQLVPIRTLLQIRDGNGTKQELSSWANSSGPALEAVYWLCLAEGTGAGSWVPSGRMNQMVRPKQVERGTPVEALAGTVERVTFHSPDTGFCVLKVHARGKRDLVPVIGHAPAIGAG